MAERRRITQNSSAPKKQTTKKTDKKTKAYKQQSGISREVWAIITVAVGVMLILAFYFDALGIFGIWLKDVGLGLFGFAGYALPVVLTILGMCFFLRRETMRRKGWYLMGLFFCVCSLIHLFTVGVDGSLRELYIKGQSSIGGGILGGCIVKLFAFIGTAGTAVILIASILILLILLTGVTPIADLKKLYIARKQQREQEERVTAKTYDDIPFDMEDKKPERHEKSEKKERKKSEIFNMDPLQGDESAELDFKIYTDDQVGLSDAVEDEQNKSTSQSSSKKLFGKKEKSADELMEEEMARNNINTSEKDSSTEKKENIEPVSEKVIADEIENVKPVLKYKFPPMDMLSKAAKVKNQTDKPEDLRESAKKLIETLKSFGVEAKVLEVSRGPSVTRFEIQPNAGVKVSKIVNLADDIALNLAAFGVRIEAPIPGKAAVGIEIPNKSISTVSLREVIDTKEFKSFKSKTAFALGKDIAGQPIIADISKMPHLLIAGTTGSGKSVCINTLISSIIYKARPDEVKLLMIDPKVVELGVYNGIPHLLIPVVTDPRKAAGALNWAVTEMVKRYKMFADCNVRDIHGYNDYAQSEDIAKLENIVIIIDELSDLMMVAPHDVEDAICRLAQMARAAGMHLVIATQRPPVDVITGLIKANIPSRIAFTVSNSIDSRTILDMTGAEKLLGRGDMLFLPVGASKPKRIQGAFVSDKEVEHLVEFIKGDYEPDYDEDILDKIENGDVGGNDEDDPGDCDEFLNQAIEIVVDCGQASVSLIQRKLKVGYARAGRIVDQMEVRGIVGPHEGSKPRQVLITKAQFYEMMMHKDDGQEEKTE